MAADVITCPAVAGILLRLLLGCDDAGERLATLQALQDLIGENFPCAVALPVAEKPCLAPNLSNA